MPDVRKQFMDDTLCQMQGLLSQSQLERLKQCLIANLHDVKLEKELYELSVEVDDNVKYLRTFVAARRLEGMSEKTLRSYVFYTKAFLSAVNKNFRDITTIDIQYYLSNYEATHKISKRSIDNMRKGINGWFLWLEETEAIQVNPFRKVHKIAYEKKPVVTLSSEDIVNIREYLHGNIRSRAMVEFLLATGVRVSEFCAIDVDDVDYINNKVTIHSAKKRNKEDRTVFLTAEAKKYLIDYQNLRKEHGWDNSPALFQSNRKNGSRFTERLVNEELRRIEGELHLDKKLTCHIFRRTLASRLHARGMSNVDVAKILGHEDCSTAEKYYINVAVDRLQYDYAKYY